MRAVLLVDEVSGRGWLAPWESLRSSPFPVTRRRLRLRDGSHESDPFGGRLDREHSQTVHLTVDVDVLSHCTVRGTVLMAVDVDCETTDKH
jgi:hypothetical protein